MHLADRLAPLALPCTHAVDPGKTLGAYSASCCVQQHCGLSGKEQELQVGHYMGGIVRQLLQPENLQLFAFKAWNSE